jgi:hypothetical protein
MAQLGRFDRQGEKGIAILAPITARRDAEAVDGESKTVVGFRAAYVFDVLSRDSTTVTATLPWSQRATPVWP